MNNLRWLTALFNTGRRSQQVFQLFGNRRNNRGGMMLSLLGVGIAAYSMTRGRNREMMRAVIQPIQNRFNNRQMQNMMPNNNQ
ncbi:hypothetical protein [Bacillus taeanensis]|uniref:DUF3918 domain-containing protein n=1 Tax=Bacillus taeanensis TaxID=273032 RepID=A0A366XR07_9BACI|nr:hypothetical protein [Bacillus taeanensis]RBW68327.1 hypothetical protein DS031_17565 [Bacillus taeanensis]